MYRKNANNSDQACENDKQHSLLHMVVLHILYVQEVVTLQKKIFNIFASENEFYTIY